jgi:hypothetical protein
MNAFEKIVVKVGEGIAWPFEHGAQLVEVLTTALKDEPAVKAAIVGLVQQVETVTADGAIAVAAKGIDLPDDIQTAAAAQTLFSYVVKTFIPAVSAAYKDLSADVKAPAPADPPPTPATVAADAVQTGPGLHTITAA